MKYLLAQNQISKAKSFIKKLNKEKTLWEKEVEKATEDMKKLPNKYYANVNNRKKYAEKQIAIIEEKIKDLEEAIKNKAIEL